MFITEERNDWDGRRVDGMLMATSVFFDRLHGGNEDHPFIESLELHNEGTRSCATALGVNETPGVEDTSTGARLL